MSGVYPITDNLKDEIPSELHAIPAIAAIIETVGEYEHGTADVEDVSSAHPVTMEQYAAVALDLALVIGNTPAPEPKARKLKVDEALKLRDKLTRALSHKNSIVGALLAESSDELLNELKQIVDRHEAIMARK